MSPRSRPSARSRQRHRRASTPRGSQAASAYKVGIVYSRTGLLAAYGAEYIEGLRLGLAYATHGTNKVNGHPIQLNIQDDGGEPGHGGLGSEGL